MLEVNRIAKIVFLLPVTESKGGDIISDTVYKGEYIECSFHNDK